MQEGAAEPLLCAAVLPHLTAPEPRDVLQDKQLRLCTKLGHGFGSAPSGQERRRMETVISVKSCKTEVLLWGAQSTGSWGSGRSASYCTDLSH